ncbi:MAG: coproporphyrinogen oxidase [Bacteroidetes bacterium]|nr:coproporphyrinogen oxidase [Bacteroidota bacterium]
MESHTVSHSIPTLSTLAERARSCFEQLQSEICLALEELDGAGKFTEDTWQRSEGGGGVTKVMEEGAVFEKAGVAVSTVFGMMPEAVARKMDVVPARFYATGVSVVLHPKSPMVPTVHANFRYFEKEDGDAWFGGGMDLTPYYPYDEDIRHFHRTLKASCDRHHPEYYPRFKQWCDDYFFLKHRGETRGVGGIFFDYLRGRLGEDFAFVQSLGGAFLSAYLPIVQKRKSESYGSDERAWQLLRRGRYVEFNLVYDRGTVFGLETQGRTESILMSLPPLVQWKYNSAPAKGTREARLIELLTSPREWIQ